SKANDELKPIASQLNLVVPSQVDEKHRNLANRLAKLKGAEFDREYITAMVEGHQEVLAKLKERANRSTATGSTATNSPVGGSATVGGSSADRSQTSGSSAAGSQTGGSSRGASQTGGASTTGAHGGDSGASGQGFRGTTGGVG